MANPNGNPSALVPAPPGNLYNARHGVYSARVLAPRMAAAKLDGEGRTRLRWHDLWHSYASQLIAQGHNIAYVSGQLGHARISITLDVYSHLIDADEQAERARSAMQAAFGSLL